eukprot:Skav226312  [mRNA]  locus=scaffold3301:565221:566585:- [translate_table: standard]
MLLAVGLAVLGRRVQVFPEDRVMRRSLQILHLFILFVYFIQSNVVLPSAYDLSSSLGFGARTSGFIISSIYLANALGAVMQVQFLTKPWIQSRSRWVMVLAALGSASLHLLFVLGIYGPWSDRGRLLVIITARVGLGWLMMGQPSWLMAVKVTPEDELVPFSLAGSVTCGLGIGAGPMLDALLRWLLPDLTERGSHAAPAAVLALVWLALCLAIYRSVPEELLLEECEGEVKDVKVKEEEEEFFSQRAKVWLHAAYVGMERALIVSALEAASSLLLEVKYGFRRQAVGLAVGSTFMFCTPLTVFLGLIRPNLKLSDGALLSALAFAALLFSFLFFRPVGAVLSSFVPVGPYWWILFADSLIFPTTYTVSGIAEGILLMNSKSGTYCSAENNVIVDALFQDSIARFVGPILARWIIDREDGQDAYAWLQIGICVLTCATSFHLYQLLQTEKAEKA